jgi:hypothetical protein
VPCFDQRESSFTRWCGGMDGSVAAGLGGSVPSAGGVWTYVVAVAGPADWYELADFDYRGEVVECDGCGGEDAEERSEDGCDGEFHCDRDVGCVVD